MKIKKAFTPTERSFNVSTSADDYEVIGNSLTNSITTGSGNDSLFGGIGADTLIGGFGNDVYNVDNTGDVVIESASLSGGIDAVETAVNFTLGGGVENLKLVGSALVGFGNSLANQLVGNSLNNTLVADLGNDTLDGGAGADRMSGGDGNDLYLVDNAGDVVIESASLSGGIDTVETAVNFTLGGGVEKLKLAGSALVGFGNSLANQLVGNSLNNTLVADLGNDTLDGGLGADRMSGGDGNDLYLVDNAADIVIESSLAGGGVDTVESKSSYTLGGGVENLVLKDGAAVGVGNSANNSIIGTSLANTLDGGLGNDTLSGGDGNDYYIVDAALDSIQESSLTGGGVDTVESKSSYTLGGGVENLKLVGSALVGFGNSLANQLVGNSLNNTLVADLGNDTLDGGVGADRMSGGDGNDLYLVDNAADIVIESSLAGGGVDTVESKSSYTLGGGVENLVLKDGAAVGVGNSANNSIIGTSLANTLDGGLGNDTLSGGEGNDYYIVDAALDSIQESSLAGGGVDTVESKSSYTLGGGLENLKLAGSALVGFGNSLANQLVGNSLNNTLVADLGNDTLDGGAGADRMSGGDGNDLYLVDNAGDVVIESASLSGGIDTVETAVNFTLGGGVEKLKLAGSALVGFGNSLANQLVGNSLNNTLVADLGNDTLDGGVGADRMSGGDGNDLYLVDNAADIVIESSLAGGGVDTVESKSSYTLGGGLENLVLKDGAAVGVGNSANNSIIGTSLANTLDGGLGNDTLSGGDGNDYYIVDAALDSIQESSLAGGGVDTVESKSSYTLGGGLENLVLKDGAAVGVGNSANNSIIGTSLANTLDGGLGNDTLSGGDGNDYYIVDAALDSIQESSLSGGGVDTVESKSSYTLGGGLENLVLKAGAAVGVGNSANNSIVGTSLANTLDGGLGNDTLSGGDGNDYYIVDAALDSIKESSLAGGGVDTVESKSSYTLGGGLENLVLKDGAAVGVGNSANNSIVGTSLANTLDGGLGNDTLSGGDGNDYYIVDAALDSIQESSLAGGGIDTVESKSSYTLGGGLENLVLAGTAANGLGNSLANVITGNSLANRLDGAVGADTLIGGGGNDTFVVDNIGDSVVGGVNTDLVESSVVYTLGMNLENLTLTGTAAINGTGNAGANIITGNSLANRLDGAVGADTLIGSGGNDTFVVDNIGDSVVGGAGVDLVESSVSYTLGANIEKLTLTGSSAINGVGNALANTISGNAAANRLNGATGADTLIGNGGSDTFVIDNIGDSVVGGAGVDLVETSVSYTLGANIEKLTLTGSSAINGVGNALANTISGNAAANRLDGAAGSDTLIGNGGNDTFVVDNIGDSVVGGAGVELVESSLSYTLGANIENLLLTGSDSISATGNDTDNQIEGNESNNTLDGGVGVDSLIGGAGDDVYIIDNESDSVLENAEEGADLVEASVTFTLSDNVENLNLVGDQAIDGTGNSLANAITGNSLENRIDGGAGDDLIAGGEADDTAVYSGSSTDYSITLIEGTDQYVLTDNREDSPDGIDTLSGFEYLEFNGETISFADYIANTGSQTLSGTEENDELTATFEGQYISGLAGDDAINGSIGADTLDGGEGSDQLTGGAGDDVYVVDAYDLAIVENEEEGTDLVVADFDYILADNVENLILNGESALSGTGNSLANEITGNSLDNTLSGMEGDDTLIGDEGADSLFGGEGSDSLLGGAGNDTLVTDDYDSSIDGGDGTDLVVSETDIDLTDGRFISVENIILADVYVTDETTGESVLAETQPISATGDSLGNTIIGNLADNSLSGGEGADILDGGAGNDTLFIDSADTLVDGNEGVDSIVSDSTVALTDARFTNFENIILSGEENISATGDDNDNQLIGNIGDNSLDGASGADTLAGGLGDDVYVIDNEGDIVEELAEEGTDLVESSVTQTLADQVENLNLVGEEAIDGTGNTLANAILGNSAANRLDGGFNEDTLVGDTLIGGEGDDILVVNSLEDLIEGGEGTDLVESSVDYVLGDDVENLTLTGEALSGTGNIGDNQIVGNAGDNTLDGGEGSDQLTGGAGDDVYVVDAYDLAIVENEEEGTDLVVADFDYILADNVENLILNGESALSGTGNSLANEITGNSLDNTLSGMEGDDTLIGDEGADSLFGGEGSDSLLGGAGNDTLVTDDYDSSIDGGDGTDLVVSETDIDLTDGRFISVENIILADVYVTDETTGESVLAETQPISATGDSLGNTIIGNLADNSLSGGEGADILDGGAGNDTLFIDSADTLVDGNEGVDSIVSDSTVALTDARFTNFENIILSGEENISATGDDNDNQLIGNIGDNSLDGASGADTLAGGLGDDVYVIDNEGDIVEELAEEGTDLVESSVTQTLADQVENLNLVGEEAIDGTGNTLANAILGNSAANRLDGGFNEDTLVGDTLIGGEGDDTLVVNSIEDQIEGGDGIDTVESSVDYVLGDDVENLTLTGEALSGTGNTGDNQIVGNAGDNTLDGGEGSDQLTGGAGDDVYVADAYDLAIVENEDEGTDLVVADFDYILADNIENLLLNGESALSGTGNSLANEITGNSLDNILSGMEGDDTLIGDEGADSLVGGEGYDSLLGGAGNDTLLIDNSDLSIDGGDGTDLVVSETNIDLTDGRFTSVENIILADVYVTDETTGEPVLAETQPISATGDSLGNTIIGNLADNSLSGGEGADTLDGGAGNDTLFIDSADTLIDGNEGVDTIVSDSTVALTETRFTNVENILLTGSDSLTATGDDGDNQIIGNDGDNTLLGGLGADYLDGGLGADSLLGGYGIDTLLGGDGNDTLVLDTLDYVGDTLSSAMVDGGDGTADWVVADFNVSLSSVYNVENILLSGSDTLTATGDGSANFIVGNSGANTITGGGGLDTLTGDGGADVFVIGDATGNAYGVSYDNSFALITDFTVGTDMLQLKGSSSSDYMVDSTDPTLVLITSIDPSVGLVAKINVVSGTAADILNNTSFLA